MDEIIYDPIELENPKASIEQTETIEYVEVEDVEDVVVEIDEAFSAYADGGITKHSDLEDRDALGQHPIVAIDGLEDVLTRLGSIKNVYAKSGGFAELRKWKSSNKGVGYFVSLINGSDGNTYVDICNENTDVYGVTVMTDEVGFYGYQDGTYNELDSSTLNILNNPTYAKVCLLGNVKVRITDEEYAVVDVGDYVIPNNLGYASVYTNEKKKIKHSTGFKVISKGQREDLGHYVGIALVPQNDNISRVVKQLEDAKVSLEGVNIQLGEMSGELESVKGSSVQLGKDFEGLKDLVNESNKKIDSQLPEIEQKLQEAVDEVVSEAEKTINDMTLEYTEAVSKADEALKQAASAIGVVDGIRSDLEPLASWNDSNNLKSAVTGFVAQADKDHVSLSTLTERVNENGANIIAVTQKIDDTGASIEQLVARADRYSLGPHSLSDKFTYDEAISMLKPGHIYVPTEEHGDETSYIKEGTSPISFTVGKSYIWKADDTGVYTWVEYNDVYTWTSYDSVQSATGLKDGDLWYCWQGIVDPSNTDKILYDAETLYRWDGVRWVSVATVESSVRSCSIGLLKQTADELTVTYTNLDDKVSTMKIGMDEISTTVMDVKEGLSEIEQTAKDITLGVYKPDESSTSLGLLLNGMESISNYGGRVCIKHALTDSPTIDGNRYLQSPMWNGEEFVFAEGALDNEYGEYYFGSDDHTEYYKLVDDGYEVYTIGNEATALLRTNVDENKAAIEGLVKYKDGELSTNLATIQAQADANSSKIASVAEGEYLVCTSIDLELTADEIANLPSLRYDNPPTWGDDGFAFSDNSSESGVYYMSSDDTEHYYKLLLDDNDSIIGYEQYALASTGSAEIMQLVTKNGSSIGMIVENDKVKASIIAKAINDSDSTVSIKADKINFEGFTKFTNSEDAIKSVEVQYASSTSTTTAPTHGWSPNAPTWSENTYIWQKTVTTYADGSTSESATTCIQGAKGQDGTGVAIKGTAYTKNTINDGMIGVKYALYNDKDCLYPINTISDGDAYLVDGYLFVYSGSQGASEYQEVEYIESTGTQYIDAGYIPNQDTTVSADFQFSNLTGTNSLFGLATSENTTSVPQFYVAQSSGLPTTPSSMYFLGYGYSSVLLTFMESDVERHLIHSTIDLDSMKYRFYIDNETLSEIEYKNGFNMDHSLVIFCRYNLTDDIYDTYSSAKLYSFKIYESGELIRDFVPCYRKSDNVIGLYDLVGSEFYTNSGTGTFLKGADCQFVCAGKIQGSQGDPGISTTGVTNYYYAMATDKRENLPTIGNSVWQTEPSKTGFDVIKKYLWNYETVSYSNGREDNTEPTIIGVYSKDGADGRGIQDIIEYYITTKTSAAPTLLPTTDNLNGWTKGVPNVSLPQTSKDKPYLWNYEIIDYTEGDDFTSGPVCIGTYGNSIKAITEYYAATTTNSAPDRYLTGTTINTDVWKISVTQTGQSATKPYVWNFERTEYTLDNPRDTEVTLLTSTPRAIDTITEYYMVKTDNSTPNSPSYQTDDNNHNLAPIIPVDWLTTKPSVSQGGSLWNCEVIKYTSVDGDGKNLYEIVQPTRIGYAGKDGAGVKKINTNIRNFSLQKWQEYGEAGHEENWTTGEGYDNTHINVGDTAYIVGTVADATGVGGTPVEAVIYGIVLQNVANHVRMTSTCLIMGGKNGIDGKTPVKGVDYFDGAPGSDGTSIIWKGTYTSAPSNAENGWAYYNSTIKASYVYQGGTWYQMSIDGVDGQNGADGTSIVWKGESSAAPTNPQKNWVYRDKDDGKIYIHNGTGWEIMVIDGNDGTDGTDGSNGLSVFITYHDSTTTPSKPTGDGTANGWHTYATSASIWMSQKVATDESSGTWGEPIKIKGSDGISIKSITVTYGTSDSASSKPADNAWQSAIPVVEEGKYLWTRTITDYTDTSMNDTVTYTYTKQGETGTAGTSVTIKTIQYQAGTSATVAPTGTWSSTIVSAPEGQYLWTKTTFSDGNVAYGVAKQGVSGKDGTDGINGTNGKDSLVCIRGFNTDHNLNTTYKIYIYNTNGTLYNFNRVPVVGDTFSTICADRYFTIFKVTSVDATFAYSTVIYKYDLKGETGPQGEAGESITEVKPQYYLSSSSTECKGGAWQYDEPTWASGKYIWTRSEITWDDGEMTHTDPVLAGALNSANEKADEANNTANDAKDTADNANNIAQETQASLNARIVDWCVDANTTIIDGAKIATGTILSKNLNTDAIKSLNYSIDEGATFSNSGTFFNLADGSISSKNFAVDAGGNLTITGKVQATSGYIGHETDGFTIDKHSRYVATVLDGLSVNRRYFTKFNDKYYSFESNKDYDGPRDLILSEDKTFVTVDDNPPYNIKFETSDEPLCHSSVNKLEIEQVDYVYRIIYPDEPNKPTIWYCNIGGTYYYWDDYSPNPTILVLPSTYYKNAYVFYCYTSGAKDWQSRSVSQSSSVPVGKYGEEVIEVTVTCDHSYFTSIPADVEFEGLYCMEIKDEDDQRWYCNFEVPYISLDDKYVTRPLYLILDTEQSKVDAFLLVRYNNYEFIERGVEGIDCEITEFPLYTEEISFTQTPLCFSIFNNQTSLFGNRTQTPGVHISQDGIGLGNGNFYIDNKGNMVMVADYDENKNPYNYSVYDAMGHRRYVNGVRIPTYSMIATGSSQTAYQYSTNDSLDNYTVLCCACKGTYWYDWATKYNDSNTSDEQRGKMLTMTFTKLNSPMKIDGEYTIDDDYIEVVPVRQGETITYNGTTVFNSCEFDGALIYRRGVYTSSDIIVSGNKLQSIGTVYSELLLDYLVISTMDV